MARMHARKHGKSGSRKPQRRGSPEWLRYGKKETERLVVKIASEGKNSSEIGLQLRDRYGIPDVKEVTGKSISKILKENELEPSIPMDLKYLLERAIRIKKHLADNPKDRYGSHRLELIESKIRRLCKYYVKKGKLPLGWKYKSDRPEELLEK